MQQSTLPTISKQQQQLIHLYQQREQLNVQQQALAEPSPTPYQTLHIDDSVVSSGSHHQDQPRQSVDQPLDQQFDQQLHYLNTAIQLQQDKLTALEKEAMHWLQGTGQNEKREIKRTQDGMTAESTLKQVNDTDTASTMLLGIAALGVLVFVLNELLSFIRANPEVISLAVVVLIAVFFLLMKKGR